LELPTTGSADELRQQIEGRLAEREDHNIQVVIQETAQVETVMWLVDADGAFLQTAPVCRDKGSSESERVCRELKEKNAQLQEELTAVQQQLEEHSRVVELTEQMEEHEPSTELAVEVERLKKELELEKTKRQQAWKTSCEQVAEQDALLTAKDEEITALRAKIAASRLSEEEEDRLSLPDPLHSPTPSRSTPHTSSSKARCGKAPLLIHSRAKMWRCSSMTGSLHWRGPPHGMVGQKKTSYCN